MFAQANSEHCRHKIFNADWIVDGVRAGAEPVRDDPRDASRRIRAARSSRIPTTRRSWKARRVARFYPARRWHGTAQRDELTHTLMKVETHNHPTAIAPFPGAATGSGGEIRDEGATGHRRQAEGGPRRLHRVAPADSRRCRSRGSRTTASPTASRPRSSIMLEGPIGAASFNNEFGRPNLAGYFRTFEQEVDGEVRGYHKPIMIAGGVGNIRAEHTHKQPLPDGTLLDPARRPGHADRHGRRRRVVDGDRRQHRGPRFRFGAARQRGDRAARAGSDRSLLAARASDNPILSIHDVGAGGLSNALPELVHGGGAGGTFDLRAIPSEEPGMSPREIWCNEAQERYVLAIAPAALRDVSTRSASASAARSPSSARANAEASPRRRAIRSFDNAPVDVPLDVILGKPPKMTRDVRHASRARCRRSISPRDRSRTPRIACCSFRRWPTRRSW